jgi:hypothetical protein
MKKFILIGCVATLFTIFLFGCGKETQSSTQGGGLFKWRVSVTPALTTGLGGPLGMENALHVMSYSNYVWDGKNATAPFSVYEDLNEFSVTKGQNLSVMVYLYNRKDLGCRQVKLEGLINGKVFKTFDFETGFKSITNSQLVGCGQSQSTYNFIIP